MKFVTFPAYDHRMTEVIGEAETREEAKVLANKVAVEGWGVPADIQSISMFEDHPTNPNRFRGGDQIYELR